MGIVNRYKMKDGVTIESIEKEMRKRHIHMGEGGKYIHCDAIAHIFYSLDDEISLNIALPEDLSTWDCFDHVLVLDEAFGQPYQPFYDADENKSKRFMFVLNVIGKYNKFMDSLTFLEKIYGAR